MRSGLWSCLAGVGIMALIALLALANAAYGGEAYCDACKGDSGWSGTAKLDEIGNLNSGSEEVMAGLSTAQKNRVGVWKQSLSGFNATDNENASDSAPKDTLENDTTASQIAKKVVSHKPAEENSTIVRSEMAKSMLAPIDEANDTAIYLDISEEATEHIPGSIAIPYDEFLNGTAVRSEAELDALLGDAGISRDDTVIIYGECMPCGGGPAPATFVYWIMRSLGHENVRVLDGTVKDWASSGRSTATDMAILPAKTYTSKVTSDFAADYDYVNSGSAQIVDARTISEFGNSSIPGAINIPYESVILNDKLREESKLKRVFAILNEEQPVVVYTNTGIKASVVWFALTMLGYDAELYSYENYWTNQELLRRAAETNTTA
ncbi:MAG: sulfurtransferase [Methanothrix sp.]|nr:sulfurtransferase [Methanothrix sp.]